MDGAINGLAKELADAIAAAVASSPEVAACRTKAREAGYEMKVKLEAVVGFVQRSSSSAAKITAPSRLLPSGKQNFELTTNDRRFLRSLRIDGDKVAEKRTS